MAALTPPSWPDSRVVVAGIGVSGLACARRLAALGARVQVVDDRDGEAERAAAAELTAAGVEARLGDGRTLGSEVDLVVTSPGWRPDAPLFDAARRAGVPIWGEPELAWRLRSAQSPPWLVVTGTDGKTTTTRMLASILGAAGLRTGAVGNVGPPLVEHANGPYDVLAVELGSFQLHWSPSVVPAAAAVLNVAPDHLDWHGSMEAYTEAKSRAFAHTGTVAIGNADDPVSTRLLARAPGRRISFTLASPRPHQLGVVEDLLVDRAFVDEPDHTAVELGNVTDIPVPGPHNVANALAAAALARAYGVDAAAVGAGLRAFEPAPHRIAEVAVIDGVRFIDDSKATSPHAASASLTSFPSIVWIGGGLGKGTTFDDVVASARPRLRGAVVLGACGHEIAQALARHAAEVPVVEVPGSDTGPVDKAAPGYAATLDAVMDAVVTRAFAMARPGDTVLLAPAAASMDMFRDYGHRGDVFAAAVHRLNQRASA